MSLGKRIGQFFTLIGGGLVLLFVFSAIANQPSYEYLLWGMLGLGLGVPIWIVSPNPGRNDSGRFRILRRKKTGEGEIVADKPERYRQTHGRNRYRNSNSDNH